MLPAVLNLLNAVLVTAAVFVHLCRNPPRAILRYFTVQSNLFCAAASLAAAAGWLRGGPSAAVLTVKFVATAAVSVTLLTVLVFLGPQYGYKLMFTGPDFWLHLACPLLALLTFFAWDRPALTWAGALLGVVPVLLYGLLYLHRVVRIKRWEDFYGFNKDGKWPLSFLAMVLGAAAVSLLLALV